jgi:hypothetical protein
MSGSGLSGLRSQHAFRGALPDSASRTATGRHLHARHHGTWAAVRDRGAAAQSWASGFAMLMSELSTAVKNHLPVKVIVMRNDMLAEVSHGHRGTGRPSRHVRLPRARVSQRVWKKSV